MFVPSERMVLLVMQPCVTLGDVHVIPHFTSRGRSETISAFPFCRQENLGAEKPFAMAREGPSWKDATPLQRLWFSLRCSGLSLPSPVSIGITSPNSLSLGIPLWSLSTGRFNTAHHGEGSQDGTSAGRA